MASPQSPSSSRPAPESPVEEPSIPTFQSHPLAGTSGSSPQCPWRTSAYDYDECSRFFDCPSHTVERRLSVDQQPGGDRSEPEHPTNVHEYAPESTEGRLGSESDAHVPNDSRNIPHQQYQAAPANTSSRSNNDVGVLSSSAPTSSLLFADAEASDDTQSPPTPTPRANTEASRRVHDNDEDGVVDQSDLDRLGRMDIHAAPGTSQLGYQWGGFPFPTTHSRDQGFEARQFGSAVVSPDFTLPRWQPDAEVTYCPICQTQFSIFVRKHHCR